MAVQTGFEFIDTRSQERSMSLVSTKLITAEEFAAMEEPADGSRQELVRGEIVSMPQPQGLHGQVQLQIGWLLKNVVTVQKLGWVVTESGVITERDPDTVRGPDVSFFRIDRHPNRPRGYFEIPPDIAVEVLSPDDRRRKVLEKIQEYLDHGVRIIWLVDPEPEAQTVEIYRPGQSTLLLNETDTLTGGDVLPEFSCKVIEFFQ